MAVSAEELASDALELLGEAGIESLDDTGIAGVTRSNYNDLVRDLLGRRNWAFARELRALSVDGSVSLPSRWSYAHLMPSQPERVSSGPARVYRSTSDVGAPFSDWDIFGDHIVSNEPDLWAEFTIERAPRDWPGFFTQLVKSALAAQWAMAVTENATRRDLWNVDAFGTPSEGGRGGKWAIAVEADILNQPQGGLTQVVDPITLGRFGGRTY